MNSKQTEIRVLGQRSIASSFLSRSSNPSKNGKEDVNDKATKRVSCVSFSEFLDQKLHKTSVLPTTVQDKSNPFRIPVRTRNVDGSTDRQIEIKKEGEEDKNKALDKVLFEQFKHTNAERRDAPDELETPIEDSAKESRKRRNPFAGSDDRLPTQRPFIILGDDSKYKRKGRKKGRKESLISNKKPRPHYNHYANGSGWWDSGMEGIDDEEVGFGEAWEGVGCTTFGGIEWH
ncbi:hypothetical protein LWI29_017276 [Acer saccharum]|uniref:Uncharacterized protein n=1 Tax=Acer saccharum TaxID=4024 RepID=A0AA39TQT6_ACESA|nr:hypothetical protein LWI29_017276 [Acer saccharum]